MKFVPQKV